jgi:hypothetical protein
MFLLRNGKEIVALTVKQGNANMKPPPEMVEVNSLPKTCHRHVFASQRQRIVALTVKIGNANMDPPPEIVEVISCRSETF